MNDLVALAIESSLGLYLVEHIQNYTTFSEILQAQNTELLESLMHDIDVAFFELEHEELAAAINILEKIKTKKFILFSSSLMVPTQSLSSIYKVFTKDNILVDTMLVIKELVNKGVLEKKEDLDYCRVATRLLLAKCPLKMDVYLKLSPSKYVRLFRIGDDFDLEDWKNYTENKKIDFLYVKKNTIDVLLNDYLSPLKHAVAFSGGEDPLVNKIELIEQALEVVQAVSVIQHFSPALQELVKTQADLALKNLEKNSFKDIAAWISSNSSKYVTAHSMMLVYMSTAIAMEMKWHSEYTMMKLTFSSLLHDIVLEDSALAMCQSLTEVQAKNFTPEQIQIFKKHPNHVSSALSNFSEMPAEVDSIILQHHEQPDGSGFPRQLTSGQFSPLSSVFVVAHDIVLEYLSHPNQPFDMKRCLEILAPKYNAHHFKKILTTLTSL